jgi:hypothetical protein
LRFACSACRGRTCISHIQSHLRDNNHAAQAVSTKEQSTGNALHD